MLVTRGFVAETNATHVFIVRDGELATPRTVACPEGITRATVFEICAAESVRCLETDLTLEDVYRADEVFCTGTMGELAGVIKIDERTIGEGKVGPMTRRLTELYAKHTTSEGEKIIDYILRHIDEGRIFIGCEGTLGVVTEATLRVLPVRPAMCLAFVPFALRAGAMAFVRQVRGLARDTWRVHDPNGIDVSDGGMAAIKIIGEAAKRESAKIRIRARSSAAAPPKELRSLFRTAGEMNAVRAARVMSSLEHAGVAPARITIIGDIAEKGAQARAPRGKKGGGVATADRVELEIEPE